MNGTDSFPVTSHQPSADLFPLALLPRMAGRLTAAWRTLTLLACSLLACSSLTYSLTHLSAPFTLQVVAGIKLRVT